MALSDARREELLQLCRMRLDAFRQQRGDGVFPHRSRHRTPISGSVKDRVLTLAKGRCFRCNASKRDTDSTDFRGLQASYARRERRCVFCALEGSIRVLLENELAICIVDAYPVTPGHSLVIPRRHVSDGMNSGVAAGQTVFLAHWQGIQDRKRRYLHGEPAHQTGLTSTIQTGQQRHRRKQDLLPHIEENLHASISSYTSNPQDMATTTECKQLTQLRLQEHTSITCQRSASPTSAF